MKIFAVILFAASTITINAMQQPPQHSPGRDSKDKAPAHSPREGRDKLTDSQHTRRSSKGFSILTRGGSSSPTPSPTSSHIERRPTSVSPDKAPEAKKGSDIRRASIIEHSLGAFAGPGLTEEELQKKLDEAKRKLPFARDEGDSLLKEILETKMYTASSARHEAAVALFASAKAQVDIAIENVKAFELYKNPTEVKLALLAVLRARNLASYAIAKKICARNPLKYDDWCKFEEENDPAKIELDKKIEAFFNTKAITEEMKTREVPKLSQIQP